MAPNEQTPLLAPDTTETRPPTPLPFRQTLILCSVIFAEPVQLTILFPFVYFMVEDFGVSGDPKQIGFYVGLLTAIFSFSQFASSLPWGWISDRIGRRPVMLAGLLGNAITSVLFGLSQSFWGAMAARALCGLLNGNVGTAKTMLGEMTDSSNRGLGFSYFGLAWNLGVIGGPILGGLLCKPAEKLPFLFDTPFWRTFPYLLPCLIAAFVNAMSFLLGYMYLEETLVKRAPVENVTVTLIRPRSDSVDTIVTILDEGLPTYIEPHKPLPPPPQSIPPQSYARRTDHGASRWEEPVVDAQLDVRSNMTSAPAQTGCFGSDLWKRRTLVATITSYAMLAFVQTIYDELYPVYMATPLQNGGLAFTATDIGLSLCLLGVVNFFVQLWMYPAIEAKFGPLVCFRVSLILYVPIFLATPVVSDIARWYMHLQGQDGDILIGTTRILTWILLMTCLLTRSVLNTFSFTSIMILVNNSAPNNAVLGTVHGISQTAAAFVRGVGPALGGALWSWSLLSGLSYPFNHHFVYIVLTAVILINYGDSLAMTTSELSSESGSSATSRRNSLMIVGEFA